MSIASQIKSFYTTTNLETGVDSIDWDGLIDECETKGSAEQDWENESTTYLFSDNSCICVSGQHVSAYDTNE